VVDLVTYGIFLITSGLYSVEISTNVVPLSSNFIPTSYQSRNNNCKYSQVGLDGHPSAQARALVTLGYSGRFWLGAFFANVVSPEGQSKKLLKMGCMGVGVFRFIAIYIYIYHSSQLANSMLADLRT